MTTILVSSKSKKNILLIKSLVEKMGDSFAEISLNDKEDMMFGSMMEKAKSSKSVSREKIMQKLKGK